MNGVQSGVTKAVAVGLAVISLAVSAMLALHCFRLSSEVKAVTGIVAQSRNRTALATLDGFSLPANRKLQVCNDSGADITISALTAFYTDSHGKLRNFNSATNQWHEWHIPGKSRQQLDLAQNGGTAWDGSVVFYAMDFSRKGKSFMLTGTSDDLSSGCVSLHPRNSGSAD
jgi:hypothetical protein